MLIALICVCDKLLYPGQSASINAKYAAILASHNSLFVGSAPNAVAEFQYAVVSSVQLGDDDVDNLSHPTISNKMISLRIIGS